MNTGFNTGALKLLFVDDEQNILSALRRLFRPEGYQLFVADSGAQGLEIIRTEAIDLVVSDMRMPQMNGAEFLAQVRRISPDTIRILLTGQADLQSTIQAINEGRIYRYFNKPWEDGDMLTTVRRALEHKQLDQEKRRLEALTKVQNDELKRLNASLEQKVKERTRELEVANDQLAGAHDRLKKTFVTAIRVFTNLLELREGSIAGHSRRVGDLALKIAQYMKLDSKDAQEIMLAGLLHDIGKIGFSDELLHKPLELLSPEQVSKLKSHPVVGQTALMALEQLSEVGKLIRCHHERMDGRGYPDGLRGQQIPLGARILAVANDFDSMQHGAAHRKRLSPEQALESISAGSGSRYDPEVVDALLRLHGNLDGTAQQQELETYLAGLKPGMVLARDVIGRDGLLLLARDYILDEHLIEQLRNYERNDGHPIVVYISTRKIT